MSASVSLKSFSVILMAGGSEINSANLSDTDYMFLLLPDLMALGRAKPLSQSLVMVSMIFPFM